MTGSPQSLGTVGHLTSTDPSLPIIQKVVFYRCNLYELSGHQSQGNVKRHASEHEMEDAQVHVPNFGGVENRAFIGVFDGHGGNEASKWCSQHLHEYLQAYLTDRPRADMGELLRQTFLDVDNVLSTPSFNESGTTAAVAVLCLEGKLGAPPVRALYCANVGDSRIVLCRNGRAERLSCLHKLDNPDERRRLQNLTRSESHSQIFTNQQGTERVLGFSLTRALGDHIMFAEYNTKDFIIGTPYTSRTVLNDQDQFIILASDGVWDRVSDQEAVTQVCHALAAGATLEEASQKLVHLALENQKLQAGWMVFDDVSVLIMRFLGCC